MKKDAIVDKYLERHTNLPQFKKENGKKFRYCRLCGAKKEAGEEFRAHMAQHQ